MHSNLYDRNYFIEKSIKVVSVIFLSLLSEIIILGGDYGKSGKVITNPPS